MFISWLLSKCHVIVSWYHMTHFWWRVVEESCSEDLEETGVRSQFVECWAFDTCTELPMGLLWPLFCLSPPSSQCWYHHQPSWDCWCRIDEHEHKCFCCERQAIFYYPLAGGCVCSWFRNHHQLPDSPDLWLMVPFSQPCLLTLCQTETTWFSTEQLWGQEKVDRGKGKVAAQGDAQK